VNLSAIAVAPVAGLTPARLTTGLFLTAGLILAALPAPAQDQNRPLSFAELATQVSPAVVNITTSRLVAGGISPLGEVPEGSPFEDFFNNDDDGPARRAQALGSGFVISADGYIVTNNHVIADADEIEIEFFSGIFLPAELIGTDPATDIALLKVDATDLPFVPFGDSNGPAAEVGDWVMAMGNPLGQGFSVSAGIISARNREVQGIYDDYIQTDAAINQGNSGGPLFNMDGEVIGVNTAILSPNGGSIGIGFSMASNVVADTVAQLQAYGETRRGWLGVRIQDIEPDMVDAIAGLERARGVLITDVPEGPARDAGLLSGDVILTFNGNEVSDTQQLVRLVTAVPAGDTVPVLILRDGAEQTVPVALGRREDDGSGSAPATTDAPEQADVLGLTLSDLTAELAEEYQLGAETGVLVTAVADGSDAAAKGLLPGDLITEAGQQPVMTVAEFTARVDEAVAAGRQSILLLVRREGNPRFVALSIAQ
jgi:serine protease Do